MRRTRYNANFFVTLLLNMFLNIEGLIISGILIALHFIFGISIWWGIGVFVAWIIYLISWMLIMGWAADCSNEPPKKTVNKNPYSAGPYKSTTSNKKDE